MPDTLPDHASQQEMASIPHPTSSAPPGIEPADGHGATSINWQRMSPKFIIVGTLRNLRGMIVPAIFVLLTSGGLSGNSVQQLIYLGIGFVITTIVGVFSLLQWQFFRYGFTDRQLVVRSGVIQKQERAVPYGRIQAINVEEAPLERLVGIVRLKVETAAGGNADVRIDALERDKAHDLREQLAAARARAQRQESGSPATAEPSTSATDPTTALAASEGEVIRTLSTPKLLALGATSGRIGPAAAVAGAILQFGTELFPDSWWDRVPWERADVLTNVSVAITLLFIAALIAWLMAIGSTALAFGGFELRRSGDQLLVQHGLLDRRRSTIPIQRIQAIVVGEQLLRQPFHYADIRFESAGGSGGSEGSQGDSGVLFPFLPLREVEGLLQRAAPEFATPVDVAMTTHLPQRALRRYVYSATIGWVVFVGFLMTVHGLWADQWIDTVSWRQLALLLLAVPIFGWLGWARWRDGGWTVASPLFLLRWRGISRETMITRTERIQRRALMTDPFQRRANLATMRVSVASGGVGGHFALPHADASEAELLLARLGGPRHEIEIRKVPLEAPSTPTSP